MTHIDRHTNIDIDREAGRMRVRQTYRRAGTVRWSTLTTCVRSSWHRVSWKYFAFTKSYLQTLRTQTFSSLLGNEGLLVGFAKLPWERKPDWHPLQNSLGKWSQTNNLHRSTVGHETANSLWITSSRNIEGKVIAMIDLIESLVGIKASPIFSQFIFSFRDL